MHCVDWLPTIAQLTGYSVDASLKLDGISQWESLKSASTNPAPRTIYIVTPGGSSLRMGDWKLITGKQKKPQLFNIAADPYEKENLAEKNAEKLAELQSALASEQSHDNPHLPEDLKGLPH